MSRRPKPEALEMMKLITKYAAPDHPNRTLDVPLVDVEADAQRQSGDRGQRKGRGATKAAEGEPKILEQRVHRDAS